MKPKKHRIRKTAALVGLISTGVVLSLFMRRKKRRFSTSLTQKHKANPDPVDEASKESFPASDAPSWTSG